LVPENLGIQAALFVDAGSLYEPSQFALDAVTSAPPEGEGSFIFDTSDIRLSTGFSIIWASPLGPLRVDIAEALLKADFDKTEIFRFGASTNF
jgi:outer membrane protein insertion porin family